MNQALFCGLQAKRKKPLLTVEIPYMHLVQIPHLHTFCFFVAGADIFRKKSLLVREMLN